MMLPIIMGEAVFGEDVAAREESGLVVFVRVDEDCRGGYGYAGHDAEEREGGDGGAPVAVGFEAVWDGEEAEVEDAIY